MLKLALPLVAFIQTKQSKMLESAHTVHFEAILKNRASYRNLLDSDIGKKFDTDTR